MKLAACNLSLVPLRAEPSHRSEMVSQILFGELFEIIEEDIDFVKVRMIDVDYEGWIQKGQFVESENDMKYRPNVVGMGGAKAVSESDKVDLIPGTALTSDKLLLGKNNYIIKGDLRKASLSDFEDEFSKLVNFYINSPYLWGGRSQFGIDCSGFSQACFKHFGITLPRDAWQQAEKGEIVDFLTEIKKGDLAFFDNEEGRITHVGIMIDSETIIHASGRVRIDKMDNEGIFNAELNKYTHRLRIVKRYF